MVNVLGLITGATLTLVTTNTPPAEINSLTEPQAQSEVNIISDYSPRHQVMSSYGLDVPTIQLESEITIGQEPVAEEELALPSPTPSLEPRAQLKEPITPHPLDANLLSSLVNAHRNSLGLPALQADDYLCSIAQSRAPELYDEIFGGGGMHSGMKRRDLQYWITENMIHMSTETQALAWWLSSPIHRRAIESSSYTHSCGACQGNSCSLLFTSYVPK